jgi:two-component system sensor histidine kinase/response regulator
MNQDTAPVGQKPVVLIVDDAPEYLGILGGMLQHDYTVRLANSGRRALQMAAREPVPDLVLLDVVMPDMDGHAVLAALREEPATRDIPVMFITSLHATSDELEGLAHGATDFIVKPAPAAVVQARVRVQVELKLTRDRLRERNAALQAEIERRERAEDVLQQTIADLEAFSYSVSHDLRAPLAVISGFAGALRQSEASALSSAGLARLDRIVAGARNMDTMISDILAYTKSEMLELRRCPIVLHLLAAEVIEEASHAYPRARVELGKLLPVCADRVMIRQVLYNLLGNALKFSGKRSDPVVRVDTEETPQGVRICVRDNGEGFDEAYAGKLFGLFQRLHSQAEFSGTGLGLAIVKRLVERHGGQVSAECGEGWTTFSFTIPNTV